MSYMPEYMLVLRKYKQCCAVTDVTLSFEKEDRQKPTQHSLNNYLQSLLPPL